MTVCCVTASYDLTSLSLTYWLHVLQLVMTWPASLTHCFSDVRLASTAISSVIVCSVIYVQQVCDQLPTGGVTRLSWVLCADLWLTSDPPPPPPSLSLSLLFLSLFLFLSFSLFFSFSLSHEKRWKPINGCLFLARLDCSQDSATNIQPVEYYVQLGFLSKLFLRGKVLYYVMHS